MAAEVEKLPVFGIGEAFLLLEYPKTYAEQETLSAFKNYTGALTRKDLTRLFDTLSEETLAKADEAMQGTARKTE